MVEKSDNEVQSVEKGHNQWLQVGHRVKKDPGYKSLNVANSG